MRASQRSHISAAVDRWLAEGLITPEQAQQMRTDIDSRPISQPPEVSATGKKSDGTQQHFPVIIIEALGYLGGAIVVVALGLLSDARFGRLRDFARCRSGSSSTTWSTCDPVALSPVDGCNGRVGMPHRVHR